MAGLLGQGWDDPQSAAIMALAGGLLQGNPGGGLLGANQAFLQAKQAAAQQQMAQLQHRKSLLELEGMERENKMRGMFDQAARDSYVSPDLSRQLSTGPMPDGSAMQGPAPGFNAPAFLNRAYGIDPFKAMSMEQSMRKDDKPISVAPGHVLWDSTNRKPIYTAPTEPKTPAPTELEKLIAGRDQYPEGHPMRGVFDNAIKKASSHAPGTVVNVDNLGLKPKDRFEMEGKLADDFNKATQQDRALLGATSKIRAALGEDGALKDQAAIYAFAKMLDPEGAVRESDYAAIANSAGLIDRVRSYADKLLKGERLSPQQRQEMLNLGGAWEKVANARIGKQRSHFTNQASRYNLSPGAVVDPDNGAGGWTITPVPPGR